MIEENKIYRELPKIQNIYQISYKDVLINCSEGMKGEYIYVNIMNLETIESQVYENESLPYNLEKISEEDTFDLQQGNCPIFFGFLSLKDYRYFKYRNKTIN